MTRRNVDADAAMAVTGPDRLPLRSRLGAVRYMHGRGRAGHRTVLAILLAGLLGATGGWIGVPSGAAAPAPAGHRAVPPAVVHQAVVHGTVVHRTPAASPASAADLAVRLEALLGQHSVL